MKIGSLFSGYGGLEMGVHAALGGETAWVSDIDKGACKILAHRYPDVPNLGDISTVDWTQVEPVDVLTGGFPCQDVSHAGKRAGLRPDTRTGLWSQMAYAIDQLRPALVVAENVRGLLSAEAHSDVEPCPWCLGDPGDQPVLRALGAVLGDLADIGYDASWYGLPASNIGAPHARFRVFLVAQDAQGGGRRPSRDQDSSARTDSAPLRPGDRPTTDSGGTRLGEHGRGASTQEAGANEGDEFDGHGPLFPTPRATDGTKGGPNQRGSSGDLMLPSAVALLPTPSVADVEGGRKTRSGDRSDEPLLNGIAHDQRWGEYAVAIARWEALTRTAPAPTMTSTTGNPQLSPRFVEWMMGLPAGWVTDVPGITRNEALKALGNGVVPQQAEAALRVLLPVSEAAA